MEIDLVVPYVMMSDTNWLKQYTEVCGKSIEKNRFKDNIFLKYFFRGIAKNMPWIRKVHLIVSSETQIPDWLDQTKVNVILHKDIIPEEYLPTFNACTIEMFEHRIPDLTEHYIVANDDFYAVGPMQISDFFTEDGKPIIHLMPFKMFNGLFTSGDQSVERPWRIFTDRQYNEFETTKRFGNATKYILHSFSPHTKQSWNTLWELYGDKLAASITNLCNAKNYNQYAGIYYNLSNNLAIPRHNLNALLFEASNLTAGIIRYDLMNNLKRQTVCLNDTSKSDDLCETAINWISEGLAFRTSSDKCKFEK